MEPNEALERIEVMPRQPRVHFPGALYHVMSRGNARQNIFLIEQDWRLFLDFLADCKSRIPFKLYAYCLMPNHFHLLIEAIRRPIAEAMHLLLTRYSGYFNRRTGRVGHLFQGRYKPILCDRDPYLLELIRYIPLNPVRAGLCSDPADWPWSSHRDYLARNSGGLVDREFPLSLFNEELRSAQAAYESFVRSSIATGHEDRFYPEKPYLGPRSEILGKKLEAEAETDILPLARSIEDICAEVCRLAGVRPEEIRSGSRLDPILKVRWQVIRQAAASGNRVCDISEFLRCGSNAVRKVLARTRELGALGGA